MIYYILLQLFRQDCPADGQALGFWKFGDYHVIDLMQADMDNCLVIILPNEAERRISASAK